MSRHENRHQVWQSVRGLQRAHETNVSQAVQCGILPENYAQRLDGNAISIFGHKHGLSKYLEAKATNLQTKIASKNHIIKSESAQITGARSLSKSHPSRGFSGHGGIFIEETGMVLVTQSKRVRNDASGGD